MAGIVIMQVLPIDSISKYGLESHAFIERAIAVNELAPFLVVWRGKPGEVSPSSGAVCVDVDEEGGGNVASDGIGVVEPVVVVPILAGDAVILHDNRHEVAEALVKWQRPGSVLDPLDDLVVSVQLCSHGEAVRLVHVRLAIIFPHERGCKSPVAVIRNPVSKRLRRNAQMPYRIVGQWGEPTQSRRDEWPPPR